MACLKGMFSRYWNLVRANEWWMNEAIAVIGLMLSGVSWFSLFTVLLSTAFIWSFGFAINDVFDAKFDKKKKNNRNPISRGEIKKSDAMKISFVLAVAGISASLFLPAVSFLFFLALLTLFFLYSAEPFRLKERCPFDAIFHGLFGSVTFLAGYAAGGGIDVMAALISLLVMAASTIAELLQEMRDYAADKAAGFSTAAIRMGMARTMLAIKLLFISAFLLSTFIIDSYFANYYPVLLSALPFAKFLFFGSSKNFFENAMKAGRSTEIAFLIIFTTVTILRLISAS